MSVMSNVHIELEELGYDKLFEIEEMINKMELTAKNQDRLLSKLYKQYKITTNAGLMIIAGAKDHKCSKAVRHLDD